jgi:hypothetical protein
LRTPNLISAGKVFADPSDSAVDTDTIAIVGERATPTYWLVHTGRAIRVGDVFPCPILTKIGDMTLVPANRRGDGYVSQWGSGLWENLYFCRWRMTYLLQGRPGTGTAGPNPIFNEGPGDHGDDDVTEDPNGDWDVSGDDQINTLRSSTGGLPF